LAENSEFSAIATHTDIFLKSYKKGLLSNQNGRKDASVDSLSRTSIG
jgi:hypothetical protein